MSDPEIGIILRAIERMGSENREDFKQLHLRMDEFFKNGCSRAVTHEGRAEDIEDRMRTIEAWYNKGQGVNWLISTLAAIVGAAAAVFAIRGK